MKKQIVSTKNFVVRNKNRIILASLVVTTAGTALMFRNQKMFNEFLKENDLYDKFYAMNEDA